MLLKCKAHVFKALFGVDARNFFHSVLGFDVVAFDKKVIMPPDGVSTREAILGMHGPAAVWLVVDLIGTGEKVLDKWRDFAVEPFREPFHTVEDWKAANDEAAVEKLKKYDEERAAAELVQKTADNLKKTPRYGGKKPAPSILTTKKPSPHEYLPPSVTNQAKAKKKTSKRKSKSVR